MRLAQTNASYILRTPEGLLSGLHHVKPLGCKY
jgi:hypothetical protein